MNFFFDRLHLLYLKFLQCVNENMKKRATLSLDKSYTTSIHVKQSGLGN